MERKHRLYLIRHGQVVNHEQIPVCGHTDVPLSDVGKLQLDHLAKALRLTRIDAIYSSDLRRAQYGAQTISRYHNAQARPLTELREMHFGDWEGKPFSEVLEEYPDEVNRRKEDPLHFRAPGGGESLEELDQRISTCLQGILNDGIGQDILIVGHGLVNRTIICNALGLDLNNASHIQQDHACLNIIDFFEDHTLVRLVNGRL